MRNSALNFTLEPAPVKPGGKGKQSPAGSFLGYLVGCFNSDIQLADSTGWFHRYEPDVDWVAAGVSSSCARSLAKVKSGMAGSRRR